VPECDCGTEITTKNAAGHYRDRCAECIDDAAPDVGRERRDPATWLAEEDAPEGWSE